MGKKTNEVFLQEIKAINPNVEILEEYKGCMTKIKWKCKIHDFITFTTPNGLLMGKGCKKCKGDKIKRAKVHNRDKVIETLVRAHPLISFKNISEIYKDKETKLTCTCTVCGFTFFNDAEHMIKRNQGCPKCKHKENGEKLAKTKETFIQELNNINKNIVILGEYKNNRINIKYKCKLCGETREASPSNLLGGRGCPCNKEPKTEEKIRKVLNALNVKFNQQQTFTDCLNPKTNKRLKFDFFVPDKNLCIEYDGEQHFKPYTLFGGEEQLKYTQYRDSIKTKYCQQKNISLLRIPYTQKAKIETILQSTLNA